MFAAMFLDAWRQTRDQWIQWLLYIALAILLVVLMFFPVSWLVSVFFPDNAMADFISDGDKAIIVWSVLKSVIVNSIGGFIGVILSIIMTAGQLPAMLRTGSIDMMVSFPHARWKLLLARYLSGVVFVGWYTFLLVTGIYVVAGVRGGSWDPKFLLCIPAMLLLFCTLYSISLLMAVLFRNAIMVILGTLGLWLLASILNITMVGFYDVSQRDYRGAQSEAYRQSQVDYARSQVMAKILSANRRARKHQQAQPGGAPAATDTSDSEFDPDEPPQTESGKMRTREQVFADAQWYEGAGDIARIPTFLLPKTVIYGKLFAEFSFESEVQDRVLHGVDQFWKLMMQGDSPKISNPDALDLQAQERRTAVKAKQEPDYLRDGGSTALVVAMILLIACWKFSRTDF